jgi:hypothetical protein
MKAKYGLPLNVEFCKICGMSNQKVTPSRVQNDTKDVSKKYL